MLLLIDGRRPPLFEEELFLLELDFRLSDLTDEFPRPDVEDGRRPTPSFVVFTPNGRRPPALYVGRLLPPPETMLPPPITG